MKKIFLIIAVMVASFASQAQIINWSAFRPNDRHMVNANAGWDYASTFGVGYGYGLKVKFPTIVNAQFSLPAGSNLTDDFKTKLGFQSKLFQKGHFATALGVYGIFRRYQSDLATLRNFGSQFISTAGFYKSSWFLAGEFGFDKAITTNIRNSELMKQNYPASQDGWYVPTGGNFQYGIQAGYSIQAVDITMKIGRLVDQSFKPTAKVPQYVQVGVNVRF